MENIQETQINQAGGGIKPAQMPGLSQKVLLLVIVLSLVFGALGGAGGAFLFFRQPIGQKILAARQTGGQTITVNEEDRKSVV